jgi:hypothetical protein
MAMDRTKRVGLVAMTVLAAATAAYSLRFFAVPFGVFPQVDAGIRKVIETVPVFGPLHMLAAPIALLFGPFQFWSNLRGSRPRVHRVMGRVYVGACLIAGGAGLLTAVHASGGPIASAGFGLLAILWLYATVVAWRAAVARRIAAHQLAMRFSFAMTFGAVTLRLQIPLFFWLGYPSYSAMSVWLAWTAWVPNVLAVLAYAWWERRRVAHPARSWAAG